MNEYGKALMNAPSIETPWCAFCGRPIGSRHHIVPKSQGGAKGPTVTVCGYDNVTGCHGRLHQHFLHLRWKNGEWLYLKTSQAMKYEKALAMEGWRVLRVVEQ